MSLPKCQCQPDLDSILRKACVNKIEVVYQSIMLAQLNVKSHIMSPSENFLQDALGQHVLQTAIDVQHGPQTWST